MMSMITPQTTPTLTIERETMAQLVGIDDWDSQPTMTGVAAPRVITYPCERCDADRDRSTCRHCEGTGSGIARVSECYVDIEGCRFDRGAESEPRIEAALTMVDEHCREDLERLLRDGPDEEDEPRPHHVGLTYEQLTDSNARPAQAAMNLHDVLVSMMQGAVQESSAPFRDKMSALAQLSGAR
jgi:hypothetical protein